jgi:small subunit ribosomal protein S11
MNQSPHQLHINATFNNTIITLTRPNGAPLVTASGGSAGFKKAARSGYEAAHQAALQLLDKMNAKNLQVPNVHIVLKGFGPGRDAAFKALVSGSPWNVKRITDATPIPFGGCRPKKARRL